MNSIRSRLLLSSSLALSLAAAANAQSVTPQLTVGGDYSVGKYGGTEDTSVYYVPLTGGIRTPQWHVELTAPFLAIHGPGNFLPGANVVVRGGSSQTSTRSGFGDVILGGGWTVLQDGQWPQIEISGTTKFPTAKSDLGTGKQDYSAQVTVSHGVAPQLTLFGIGGYQWLGSPAAYQLKSGPTASGGFTYKPSTTFATGASLDYRAASYQGLSDQVSVSPFVYWTLSHSVALSGYSTVGLSKSAPAFGIGARAIFSMR